jgi:hypothetical protein
MSSVVISTVAMDENLVKPQEPDQPEYLDLEASKIQLATFDFAERFRGACDASKSSLAVVALRSEDDILWLHDIVTRSLIDLQPELSSRQRAGWGHVVNEGIRNGARLRNRHGKPYDPMQYQQALVQFGIIPSMFHVGEPRYILHIDDEGKGFDPHKTPNHLHPKNLEKGNGRGVHMIGYYTAAREKHNLGGDVHYLPLTDDAPENFFLTRELLVSIPLLGESEKLVDAFRAKHRGLLTLD